MKNIPSIFISLIFSFCAFAQEHTQTNGKESFALSYTFTTDVKNDSKLQDNTYTREVEIHKTRLSDKIVKYDFFCLNFEIKGPNNHSYLKKVGYAFDEISVLVNVNGRIIEVTKPADMDERWEKTKGKILLDYKGEVITNYLREIDQTIEDKEKLTAFLQSDTMYGFFLKALSEIDNPIKSSKIKTKEGLKIITPEPKSIDETVQYTFQNHILNNAVKTLPNIKYEIKLIGPITP